MRVGLDHEAQVQPALFEIGQVVRDSIDTRVDEGRFACVDIGQEIREAVLRPHLVNDERLDHRLTHVPHPICARATRFFISRLLCVSDTNGHGRMCATAERS